MKEIIKELSLGRRAEEALAAYFEKRGNYMKTLSENAYDGEPENLPVLKREPFDRLAVVCYKLTEVKAWFGRMQIPARIYFDTISDITLRECLYEKRFGKPGLTRDDARWFRHIFSHRIFKFYSLQFQLFNMIYLDKECIGEDYMIFPAEQKKKLPSDAPVLNVHIPKGADLSPEAVEKSFAGAADFFGRYFPEHRYRAFICYSWLLYPGNRAFLEPSSNIIRFAERFEIIATARDNKDAVKRIYGKRYRSKGDYPQETSLQRNALAHLHGLGEACGVIYR